MTIRAIAPRIIQAFALLMFGIALTPANVFAFQKVVPLAEVVPGKLVNVQLKWLHQFQFAGYYMAIEQGYYQTAGLNVILHERKPGATPIDKLIYGSVDYAISGVGALYYRANGLPLVALAAIFQHSPSTLISRYPDMDELKGKKVMLSKGVMNAEIIAMMLANKVTKDDIELVPSNQSTQGFVNGEIDAFNGYITNEPFHLKQRGVSFTSFYPKDYGIDFYGDILLTTEKKLQQSPEEVDKFKQASLLGWQYAIDNIDETVDIILRKYNTQHKTREQLTFEAHEIKKLIFSDIVPVGYMSKSRWQSIANVLNEVADLDFDEQQLEYFLYRPNQQSTLANFVKYNVREVTIIVCTLIGAFLLWHNYHLKLTVSARTKQLTEAREQAEIDARTDSLTGLANRRHFTEAAKQGFSIAERNGLKLSLISLDIDWFKKVNDTYGHHIGDLALIHIASIFKRNIRSSDTLARIGGEEFVILCIDQITENEQSNEINQLAERIRLDVQNTPLIIEQGKIAMTVSIGIAQRKAHETIDELVERADGALYAAKDSGRNKVCCA